MKQKLCPRCAVPLLCLLYFAPAFGYNAAFFSFVQPGSPTELDSISIISNGYFQGGGVVIDSLHSRSGNQFKLSFTVSPDTQYFNRLDRIWKVGKLAAGNYTIITSTFYLDTSAQGKPDTEQFIDTITFQVANANTQVPRIVGSHAESDGLSVPGNNALSYYYLNGDTLSIAVAFPLNDMPSGFLVNSSIHSDTIDFAIIDTTTFEAGMFMPYIVIGSIAPVKPGKYTLRVQYQRRSCINPYKLPNFHLSTIDCSREGLTFSVKKAGAADFTLFPADTDMTDYSYKLFSPYLDTLRVISFQPNPLCNASQYPDIFFGMMTVNWAPIVDWESFNKSDWHYQQVQTNDVINYDTLNINSESMLRISYSNSGGQAVRSYIYRNLDSAIICNNSTIRLRATFNSPDISAVNKGRKEHIKNAAVSSIQISYSISSIRISLPQSEYKSVRGKLQEVNFIITDLHGRTIRTLNSAQMESDSQKITAIWDKCDAGGNRVPAGTYMISIGSNNPFKNATAIVLH